MKIAIFSDTHRNTDLFHRAVQQAIQAEATLFIHAGDETRDVQWLMDRVDVNMYTVSGNWDKESEQFPRNRVIELNSLDVSIFVTHGHLLYVNSGVKALVSAAQAEHAQIAVYGHTHVAFAGIVGDLIVINPGSLPQPRKSTVGTFALLEVTRHEDVLDVHVEHLTVEGHLADQFSTKIYRESR